MSSAADAFFTSSEFLSLLQKRDNESIAKLVRAYTGTMLKGALSLGFDLSTSEELVQRVWSTFFDVAHKFQGRSHVRTFIFGILYKKASELRREQTKFSANDPIEDIMESKFDTDGHWIKAPVSPESFMLSSETMELIKACIDLLPINQRMAFCMKEIDEHGSEDICNVLEVSATNLGVLLYRARNKLRECIERKSR